MTDGIVIGFTVGFLAVIGINFAIRKETSKDVIVSPEPLPPTNSKPKGNYVKYQNCRVGEKVYVNYQDTKAVDIVEVLAINEAGIIGTIITDKENATGVFPQFYAHKYVFRTYKKEGIENE